MAKVSPDGQRIAWEHKKFRNNEVSVWIMNADGSSKLCLTEGFEPDWGPDGGEIIYRRKGDFTLGEAYDDDDPKVHGSLWIMNVDTKEKQQFLPKTNNGLSND